MDPSEKEQYEAEAAKDKERYDVERAHYEEMYGKPETRRKRKRRIKKDYDIVKRYLNSR